MPAPVPMDFMKGRVSEEHGKSVDAHSLASDGRETVFQPNEERMNQTASRDVLGSEPQPDTH